MKARRNTPSYRGILAAGVIIGMALAAGPAAAGSISYVGSLQMASGSYFFNQTTRGYYFVNGFSFSEGAFTLTANIPLIYQSTPYVSYSGIGLLPSGGADSSLVSRRQGKEQVILPEPVAYNKYGVGDPLLSIGFRLWREGEFVPSAQITAQAKIPLASLESGFGTGQWDYAAGLSLGKKVGSAFLFADLTYWKLGDLPDLILKDAWSYGFSLGRSFSGGAFSVLASYAGYTQIISWVAPPSSLGLGLGFRVGAKSSLMLNASFGLSESSPDVALSLGWIMGF